MASNAAVFLFSFSSILFGIAAFTSVEGNSFEFAVTLLAMAGLAWAFGSVMGYLVPAVRQLATKSAFLIRGAATIGFTISVAVWPWASGCEGILIAIAFFCAGVFVPSVIGLNAEVPGEMRDTYAASLLGSALGAIVSSALLSCVGVGALFPIAAAAALLAPVTQPRLFFSKDNKSRRWMVAPAAVVALALVFIAPTMQSQNAAMEGVPSAFASETVFQFRPERKFDVYVIGAGAARHSASLKPETLKSSVRSLTVTEQNPAAQLSMVEGVDLKTISGNGRRKLAGETKRFDLIQVVAPRESLEKSEPRFDSRAEGGLTVEAARLYFDRLKDDGFLQVVGRMSSESAQATLSTIAEAWKKSARADVDLHAVAVTSEGGKTLETVIVRMKPFTREERDRLSERLNQQWKEAKSSGTMVTTLVSDSSGAVLTDNRPFAGTVAAPSTLSRTVMWLAVVAVLGLIVWVAMQERRKGIASRWQTASVATYFGGLGMSFAFFQVFFVLRAIRGWGIPSIAVGLVMAAVFISLAAGATLLAGHPRRRYGVRIQPLANFVFAAIFTYLGAALIEPLVATGSEWISAFVGMSVLIPFGLLGGSFMPNALEEASEKLAPKVLSLLWALYAAGTAVGIYLATLVGVENGLDVVFLAGLFCFAWVAIFSGLVRPWNVRKTPAVGENTNP